MKKNIKFILILILVLFSTTTITFLILKKDNIKNKVEEIIDNKQTEKKDEEEKPIVIEYECRKKMEENDYNIVYYIENIETLDGIVQNTQLDIELQFHNETDYKMYKDSLKDEEKVFRDENLQVKYSGGEKQDYTKNEDGTERKFEYELFEKDLIKSGYTCKQKM